jgi:predicted  nucleic acid-binding Zn-ribbon protein
MANYIDLHLKVLENIDTELIRLHGELKSFNSSGAPAYKQILELIEQLNDEVIRLSQSLDDKDDS